MAEIIIRVSDRALKITGIFLGAAVLVWVFIHLWSSGVFVPKYRLRVFVPEDSGLGVHAKVRLDGVQVGSVNVINLAGESASPERRIELILQVDKRYQGGIRSDSVATAIAEGLLGNRYLSIRRGFKGSVINPDGEIQFVPTREMTLKDALSSFKKTMDCLQVGNNSAENKTQVPSGTPTTPRH
jgi:ABC-type transporter Mla subunit MlaD